jgi:hypothetical protein
MNHRFAGIMALLDGAQKRRSAQQKMSFPQRLAFVEAEYPKIQQKVSNLSRKERDAVVAFYDELVEDGSIKPGSDS